MRRHKHLLERVIDLEHLCRSFQGAAAGKRRRPAVCEFELELEARLLEIRHQAAAGAYRWGPYHRFEIRDPKRRVIRAPPFRDRVLHHAIAGVVNPLFERGFIADTYACIRGRGQHRAVERFRRFARAREGGGYVLKCDISRYFASVDHGVLLALLGRRIGDPRLLELLGSLIAHGAEAPGTGMPIGSLTSQVFANLYLDPLDHFAKESSGCGTTCATWTTSSCSQATGPRLALTCAGSRPSSTSACGSRSTRGGCCSRRYRNPSISSVTSTIPTAGFGCGGAT